MPRFAEATDGDYEDEDDDDEDGALIFRLFIGGLKPSAYRPRPNHRRMPPPRMTYSSTFHFP